MATDQRARVGSALRRATGTLSTSATTRMEESLPWFAALSAQERSWVGLIVQAGIRDFVEWYAGPGPDPTDPTAEGAAPAATADTGDAGDAGDTGHRAPLASSVFGAAPRELTGVISLQQTVDLIRLAIGTVEANIDGILDPADSPAVHDAVLHYAREVAFATAEVYARAAESRGAWDARLEALVVDAVLRSETDETVLSRASALGWDATGDVAAVLGAVPPRRTETDVFEEVRRVAGLAGMDALCAAQGDRLVVLLGGVDDPLRAAGVVAGLFGDGPVVVGPVAPDLVQAHASARAALSAHRAAAGWPEAPRPVAAVDLLPERALAGDGHARRHLVDEVHRPLTDARAALVETLAAYFEAGSSIEATARVLFVHPNTVRYRLRQVADLTDLSPTDPRGAFTLQVALVLGRQFHGG